jgi:hypothetical protein
MSRSKSNRTEIRANLDYYPRRSVRGKISIVRKSRKNMLQQAIDDKSFWMGVTGGALGTGGVMGMASIMKRMVPKK